MPNNDLKVLDLTLATPAENLACDEVLLDWCEQGGGEVLRFWEPAEYFVVAGHGNRLATEVNQAACRRRAIPIYRRCSGGGTVLQGPGCLNYSLLLHIPETGPLATIRGANQFVMERNRAAVEAALGEQVQILGHTDLTVGGRKFSGNAQRRHRRALLFHGAFLHHFDLGLMGELLAQPSRPPDYRQGRGHDTFLMNLPLSPALLKQQLQKVWRAGEQSAALCRDAATDSGLMEKVRLLAKEKYDSAAWNAKF